MKFQVSAADQTSRRPNISLVDVFLPNSLRNQIFHLHFLLALTFLKTLTWLILLFSAIIKDNRDIMKQSYCLFYPGSGACLCSSRLDSPTDWEPAKNVYWNEKKSNIGTPKRSMPVNVQQMYRPCCVFLGEPSFESQRTDPKQLRAGLPRASEIWRHTNKDRSRSLKNNEIRLNGENSDGWYKNTWKEKCKYAPSDPNN